jgi:dihydropteroate synthase
VAIKSGADIINDISGLQHSEEMAGTVAEFGVGLILMHMRGMPENMQNEENLQYECLLEDICLFLKKAVEKAVAAGVKKESIAVDPGIGFSKNLHQNLEIIKNIDYFRKLGYPVLAGPSRKSFIGELLEQENPGKRVWGTAGAAVFLALKKVDILRVHDVKEISEAVTVAIACKNGYRK